MRTVTLPVCTFPGNRQDTHDTFQRIPVISRIPVETDMQRLIQSAQIVSRLTRRKTCIVLFLLILSLHAQDTTTAKASVTFPTLPDNVTIFVNGLEKNPNASGTIFTDPGPVLVEIKRKKAMAYSSIFILDSAENRKIPFSCTEGCVLLHITTEPNGATISMDGVILGTSPYLNGFIPPGSCSFMVTHPGRIPVIRRVELATDSVQYFSFPMEYTQAVKDSLTAARRALKQKRQKINASLFGTAALGLLAAGGYYDQKAYNYLMQADRASSRYDMAETQKACDDARKTYQSYRDKARRPIDYRNILYSAAGVCIIGLYLSFVF